MHPEKNEEDPLEPPGAIVPKTLQEKERLPPRVPDDGEDSDMDDDADADLREREGGREAIMGRQVSI